MSVEKEVKDLIAAHDIVVFAWATWYDRTQTYIHTYIM